MFSGSIRPFVTGLIPVVGDYPFIPYAPAPYTMYPPFAAASAPVYTSPLADRLERLRAEKLAGGKKDEVGDGKDDLVLGGAEPEKPAAAVAGGSTVSSAARGDISIAEIRRLQAADEEAKRQELESLIEEARIAEQNGHLGVARVRYQQALRRATGDQRKELQESLAKLKPQR
jgi:hypothetical protein